MFTLWNLFNFEIQGSFIQVHKLICEYDRKDTTIWGNVNAKTSERLYKIVSLLYLT